MKEMKKKNLKQEPLIYNGVLIITNARAMNGGDTKFVGIINPHLI